MALLAAAFTTWLFHASLGSQSDDAVVRRHPPWIRNVVLYGMIPAFYGGISGVANNLDNVAALGANAIWLAPIMDAPERDSGYDVLDHYRISPSLGSEDDLRRLVAEAHARHVRVILDIALNHLSAKSPIYRDVLEHGRQSQYFDFFERDEHGEPTFYFNWTGLKNLNYKNPEVREYACGALEHWLKKFDIDGFRLDAAWAINERAPDFWPQCFARLKRIKPDIMLIAEASARDPRLLESGFDVAYDWTDHLGEWAWASAFNFGEEPAAKLRQALSTNLVPAGDSRQPPRILTLHFLNNNDTGERFITAHGVGMARAAAALLLTVPGLPALYMGEEVGAEYFPYGGPHLLSDADPHGLRPYLKKLVALRHELAVLRSPDISFVDTSNPQFVLAYARPSKLASRAVLVVINFSDKETDVGLGDGKELATKLGGTQLKDLLDGSEITLQTDAPSLKLEPYAVKILQRRN